MARGMMMVVLALAATVAQAADKRRILIVPLQGDADTPTPDVSVAPSWPTTLHFPEPISGGSFAVTGAEGRVIAQRAAPDALVLRALSELGSERIPLFVTTPNGREYRFMLVSAGTAPPDANVVVVLGNIPEPADAHLGRATVEMLLDPELPRIRYYEPALPARGESSEAGIAAYVQMAIRQGGRFFLQVVSDSPEPWSARQALLEGADGTALIVEDIQTRRHGTWNYSVIVAEVPEGVSADYVLSSIRLVGHDLRVAVLGGEVLP